MLDLAENRANLLYDRVLIAHRRKTEIRKFRDPRRVAITDSVVLAPGQMREIDDFFVTNYGEKIPYTWHRHYTAFTGHFDVQYFPELLYIPEFEHFMNLWPYYNKAFSDKNVLPLLAGRAGVKMPEAFYYSARGAVRDGKDRPVSNLAEALKDIGEVFIKTTVDSSSGRGCFLARFQGGVDVLSGDGVQDVVKRIGTDFAIQERLRCHPSISALHPQSVNTFRVMTYRWGDEIIVAPSTMRLGSGGSYLDNVHSGGMCIAVDDDGRLHDTAYTEFNVRFQEHPDSHVIFKDYRIPDFPRVPEAARRLHELLPQLGVVHWDFTIDQAGDPVLLEANTWGTSIQLLQRPRGCGAFGDRTAEILRWMRKMKRLNPADRYRHAFGR